MAWRIASAAAVGTSVLLAALFVLKYGDLDDAYITFAYARNLAEGRGFVFSDAYDTWGTTTPLFTLMLAAASRLGASIPMAARAFDFGGILLQMAAAWWLVRQAGLPRWAPFAAALIPIPWRYLTSYPDMEYGLYAGCCVFAIVAAMGGRWRTAAGVAAAAALLRPDGALAWLFVAAAWIVHTRGRQRPVAFPAIMVLPVAAWYAFAWWNFGSLTPQTLGTRRIEALAWGGFGPLIWNYLLNPVTGYGLLAAPIVAGTALAARTNRRFLWIGGFAVAFPLMYWAAGIPGINYYLAPVVVVGIPMCVIAAVLGWRWAGERFGSEWRVAAPVLVAGCVWWEVLFAPIGWVRLAVAELPHTRLDAYRSVGVFLDESFPPGTPFAANEIGVLGFFCAQPLLEVGGLVNPEGAAFLKANDMRGLIEHLDAPLLVSPDLFLEHTIFPGEWTGAPPGHLHLGSIMHHDRIAVGVYIREGVVDEERLEQLSAELWRIASEQPPITPFARLFRHGPFEPPAGLEDVAATGRYGVFIRRGP